MKQVIALEDGFLGGVRIRKGQKFKVEDKATGKWFVEVSKFKPSEPKDNPAFGRNASKRKAQSFVELMGKPLPEDGGDGSPDTLSGLAQAQGKTKFDINLTGDM